MSQLSERSADASSERNEEDIFNILIATDIHLGYAEDDPVRGPDTFETLEEILQIAATEQVDFVLLGGDLFHDAQPSPYCIFKCMELFKKYCLGDRPVTIEFLSDPAQNFSQSENPTVNYEDPNLNIELPVFSIHGNHDDPTGQKYTSSLDLLATSGLVNYFGKWSNFDHIEISPILLKKGNSKLALYGLSHIRDERLGRLFLDDKVKMLSPGNADDWFHLLVWHQNRASRGSKNFIPDHTLPEFLDLVIWGHEHDCRIVAERKPNGVHISQPGSSVATSLIGGEAEPKHVGILKIHKKDFKIEPVELKTVRPFVYREIILKDDTPEDEDYDEDSTVVSSEYSKQLVTSIIEEMIKEAKEMGHTPKVSEKPLIRLIVRYKNEKQVFNTIRFGQSYVGKVANPENMLKFSCLKERTHKKNAQGVLEVEFEGPVLADRVEDLVSQHFTEKDSLSFFALNSLNEAVKKYIDSNDVNAISDVADNFMKEALKHLEKDLPEVDQTEQCILNFKNDVEKDAVNFVNNILNDPKRQKASKQGNNDDDDDVVSVIIDDDDDSDDEPAAGVNGSMFELFGKTKKPSLRGTGAGGSRRTPRARGPRRAGRGRAGK